MLDLDLLKVVKYGYILERGQFFPIIVGISEKGEKMYFEECELNES